MLDIRSRERSNLAGVDKLVASGTKVLIVAFQNLVCGELLVI